MSLKCEPASVPQVYVSQCYRGGLVFEAHRLLYAPQVYVSLRIAAAAEPPPPVAKPVEDAAGASASAAPGAE